MDKRENILLIRLKSIGDVVLTLPAVNVVRDNFPGAKITFLTSKEHAPLLRGFREVNEVLSLDRAALRSGNPLKMTREFFGLLKRLRAGKFSLVVDFQGYGETAWLTRFTNAPQRWGQVYGPGRAWAYTGGIARLEIGSTQIVDYNLAILKLNGLSVGAVRNEFCLPADALTAAFAFFAEQKLETTRPTMFVQAFTSSPQKNWPLENFLALAQHFRAAGTQVIFACGPGEVKALRPVQETGFVIAAGLPLLAVAGVMQLCSVIVGGVTGVLHIAVAMQKRVVMLVGSPKVEPSFPYQHNDWAVAPTGEDGTAHIKIGQVISACERALSESNGNVSC